MYRNEVLLAGKVHGDASRVSERAPWKFTLTQGGHRKKDSEQRWPKSFFNVICWPDKCEGDASEVKDGGFVEVTGRLVQREYLDRENNKRTVFEIVADSILLKSREMQEQPKPLTPDFNRLGISDADIPF